MLLDKELGKITVYLHNSPLGTLYLEIPLSLWLPSGIDFLIVLDIQSAEIL